MMLVQLLCVLSLIQLSQQIGLLHAAGPLGKFNIKLIKACPGYEHFFEVQMVTAEGKKCLSGQMNLTEEYNDKWTVRLSAKKLVGTTYVKSPQSFEGPMCKLMKSHFPNQIAEIYKQVKVEGDCAVPAGFYPIKFIYATTKDIKRIPALPYGTFQATGEFKNGQKKVMGCLNIHIEHTAK